MLEYQSMDTIYDLNLKQTEQMLAEYGQKSYRAKQLYSWLYRKRADSFTVMSDLPSSLTEELGRRYTLEPVKEIDRQVAKDGTVKYLFEMNDGASVEAVLMHFHFGESLCVSSQIGCNMGCTFCASGLLKKQRDLTAGEMVGEVMYVQKELDREEKRINNIVIMGTGEPFDNYENVMRFCEIINSDHGLAIGARHITISTCGIVPRINDFAAGHYQYNLAVFMPTTGNSFYLDKGYEGGNYATYVGEELPEFIHKVFGFCESRENTLIGGLSMGGYGAIRNGLKYSYNFSKIGMVSAALITEDIVNYTDDENVLRSKDFYESVFGDLNQIKNSDKDPKYLIENTDNVPEIFMACGDEDFLFNKNVDFYEYLDSKNLAVEFIKDSGEHTWEFCDKYIKEFIKRL